MSLQRPPGISLVFVGQGRPDQARAFREEQLLSTQAVLLCDPNRVSYRGLGWSRGWWSLLHPLVFWRALLAVLGGHRQGALQGDAFQNGGVILTNALGEIVFRHRSVRAGHQPGPRQMSRLNALLWSDSQLDDGLTK